MKKLLSMLIAAVLCLGTICCQAESAAETESEPQTEVLTFSSFDGGGPEYRIEIKDPELMSYTGRKVYDKADHEMMTGSSYNEIYTFTGLKSGTTEMTVHVTSPLTENFDLFFTVTVDDDLNIAFHQEQSISRFELSHYGDGFYHTYDIVTLNDEYRVSVNGDEFRSIDAGIPDSLCQVVEKYDLFKWDGFNESEEGVLDGEGFLLVISFADGTTIWASGNQVFPENYFPAMQEMEEILEGTKTASPTKAEELEDFLESILQLFSKD